MNQMNNIYRKFISAILCVISVIGLAMGINSLTKDEHISVIGGADGPTAIYFESKTPTLEGIVKMIASAALLVASVGTLLLALIKMLSKKEDE